MSSGLIYLFPFAGGSEHSFKKWRTEIDMKVEVRVVVYPGRGRRFNEKPQSSLLILAEQLAAEISLDIQQSEKKVYSFFGHSLGALVAFEVARIFHRQGHALPFHLFVSGMNSPQNVNFMKNTKKHLMLENEFKEYIYKMGGTPQEVLADEELMTLILPSLLADFKACETYEYKNESLLPIPVTVFGSPEDSETNMDAIYAWKEMTSKKFQTVTLSGNHFYIHSFNERLKMISEINDKFNLEFQNVLF